MIDELRAGADAAVYLDGGDLLFAAVTLDGQPDAEVQRDRARLLARGEVRAGAAAVNVGRRDLAAGLPFVVELGKDPGVPWVATNLARADGTHPVPRWREVRWGEVRLGVVGVLAPDPARDAALGIRVEDPETALGEVLPALRGRGVDAVVCLSNLGLDRERQLAGAVPGLLAVVGGGTNHYLPTPLAVGDTLILHGSDRGRFLGVLAVSRQGLARWEAPRNAQGRAVLEARLQAARRQTALLEAAGPGADAREVARQREALAGQIRGIEAALGEIDRAKALYRHELIALDSSRSQDPEVGDWVAAYKGREAAWRRRARKAARQAAAAARGGERPPPRKLHVGTSACRRCHPDPSRVWAASGHARAYAVLGTPVRDPQCLRCHTSRLERAGGASMEPVVGCEACHGPGGDHRGAGGIVRAPAEATCRSCHNGFHPQSAFDFPSAYRAVRCDRGRKLTERGSPQ
ncbi:MAG: hypothetical protein Kow0092_12860 [Deferrisomatales bacterium]